MTHLVFLDTQAYEMATFNMESAHFQALAKHLESGRLRLVITDITKAEVHRRIEKRCQEELAELTRLRKKTKVLRSAHKIEELGLFSDMGLDRVSCRLHRALDAFLDKHRAIVIAAMAHKANFVFEWYFAAKPPFGREKAKSKEFPDAFVVAGLIDWTDQQSEDLFVVSADALLRSACRESARLKPLENISILLDRVTSDDAGLALAEFLRNQITGNLSAIESAAQAEFMALDFHVDDDEWEHYAKLTVTEMNLRRGPELVDIFETEVIAELRFDADYEARLSYYDPYSYKYDEALPGVAFMEHVDETVDGTAHLLVTVTAAFAGTNAGAFQIRAVDLTEPAEGFGIRPSRS